MLGSTESGGDTGDSVGCVEERKQVGEVNGGDGGGGHGEQDKGRQEASWECVEDGKTVGYGSGGGVELKRTINSKSINRSGNVEGREVDDVVLDTGCACTMVRQDLVPKKRLVAGATVHLRCAHGDVVTYPLATVKLEIEGVVLAVTAAVADKLPVSVLLGTDVPELGKLMNQPPQEQPDALVVTRAQAKANERAKAEAQDKQEQSQVCPNLVDESNPFSILDADLFEEARVRQTLTRREKRVTRHQHGLIRAKDLPRYMRRDAEVVDVNKKALQQMQETDETLEVARDGVNQPTKPFFKEEDLLYWKWETRDKEETEPVTQLVLPKECRQKALGLAHSIPLAGHLGRKKTYARLAQRFYWPSMRQDVAEFCRRCGACQKFSQRKPARVPMIPLPVVDEPFSRVAMDLVGPLPRSRSGNRYVLVMCDYATRYPEAVPLRNIDAEMIAEELVKIFARMGIPQEILTDQGSNFQSQLLQELYHLLRVSAIRTSPYHPQTDGLVERFNQTLKSMLRKCAAEEGKDWDKTILFLLFAYREVPQESTGFSPFELLCGRDVRGPLDVLKETWVSSKRSSQDVLSYVMLMRDRMSAMSDHVQENLKSAGARQKKWYDKNARDRSFQVGEQVLVLLPTSSSKLTAQWQSPYQVVSRVGNVNYLVHMPDHRKKKRVLHINMLQKWHQPLATVFLAAEEMEQEEVPA